MNKTKILSAVISAAMAFGCMAYMPQTNVFEPMTAVASYGEEVTYGDYLTIQKVDEDENGTYDYVKITDCDEYVTEIEIPAEIDGLPVTSIRDKAFSDCTALEKISIPDSLTNIGWRAFDRCESLTSITIPDSVTSIGGCAFGGTPWLKSKQAENPLVIVNNILIDGKTCSGKVTIPDGVTSIGDEAFNECGYLTNITFPDSVTSIGSFAFSECVSLDNVIIPDNVTSIGKGAFSSCTYLKGITISSSVTRIEDSTFYYCLLLNSVTIPDSVTSIGKYAFEYCISLKSVTIPDNVTSIEERAFYYCKILESITIENPKCKIYDHPYTICNEGYHLNGTVYGYSGSTAQAYAEEYGYTFESLGEAPVTVPTETPEADANGDGKTNVRDCAFIASALAKGKGNTLPESADFNGDGKVNVRDAAAIAKALAKI